ncbi:hypothetical protein FHG87_009412 [Trinorchestia longiramus]|nr:hypothetical protein FHG87_009412 [Trinorchestia longiramus]
MGSSSPAAHGYTLGHEPRKLYNLSLNLPGLGQCSGSLCTGFVTPRTDSFKNPGFKVLLLLAILLLDRISAVVVITAVRNIELVEPV